LRPADKDILLIEFPSFFFRLYFSSSWCTSELLIHCHQLYLFQEYYNVSKYWNWTDINISFYIIHFSNSLQIVYFLSQAILNE
jgi:hypothetical protein